MSLSTRAELLQREVQGLMRDCELAIKPKDQVEGDEYRRLLKKVTVDAWHESNIVIITKKTSNVFFVFLNRRGAVLQATCQIEGKIFCLYTY